MILEPIWEADFSQHSYGFRPNRSTKDAMKYIGRRLTGSGRVPMDYRRRIASYFDTIPHRRLNKAVKKQIRDSYKRNLIWKFLRAGVMHHNEVQETVTGTPQGGIVSPLLANIYLHELDRYMESTYLNFSEEQTKTKEKEGYRKLTSTSDTPMISSCSAMGQRQKPMDIKEKLKEVLKHHGTDALRGKD